MKRMIELCGAGYLGLAAAFAATGPAQAGTCRAVEIMASQCTWFVLEEVGGDKREAAAAEHAATSGLIDGCSQGEYQMVLLRGTGVTQAVAQRLRRGARPDSTRVKAACAAEALRVGSR